MNLTVKTGNCDRDTAGSSRFSSPLTADSALFTSSAPLFPATPFSPASGPVTGSFNGLHRESSCLAIKMRKEYDFSAAKRNPYMKCLKKAVPMRLEPDVINYFLRTS